MDAFCAMEIFLEFNAVVNSIGIEKRNLKKVKTISGRHDILTVHHDVVRGRKKQMSYSTMAHALISYVENHLRDLDLKKMSDSFGFSQVYLGSFFRKI